MRCAHCVRSLLPRHLITWLKIKTQTEILETLHKTCSQLTTFKQECITLVDYYSSIFFSYIASILTHSWK
ncbi:SAPOSIN-RELATED [Salix viminalis]|uniref:SAPOSIN-RELATED n=1 Tax=Salix viminalis TaxID=40686 RepID=A0A9Q0ZPU4_SALVM|nr:SAPOSIN-RELATED [Salix viminalis]